DAYDFAVGHGDAEQPRETFAPQVHDSGFVRTEVTVDHRSDRDARADLFHQGDRALNRDDLRPNVGAALEARRRFGLQAEPFAGAPDRWRVEIRALVHDERRGRGHFRRRAAHYA